jgi:hypothetical protein
VAAAVVAVAAGVRLVWPQPRQWMGGSPTGVAPPAAARTAAAVGTTTESRQVAAVDTRVAVAAGRLDAVAGTRVAAAAEGMRVVAAAPTGCRPPVDARAHIHAHGKQKKLC